MFKLSECRTLTNEFSYKVNKEALLKGGNKAVAVIEPRGKLTITFKSNKDDKSLFLVIFNGPFAIKSTVFDVLADFDVEMIFHAQGELGSKELQEYIRENKRDILNKFAEEVNQNLKIYLTHTRTNPSIDLFNPEDIKMD